LSGRIGLIVPEFPRVSETFIVTKFLGLLERGWDVQIFCGRSEEAQWERFPQLKEVPGVSSRVHVSWPHEPRWKAILLGPLAVLGCFLSAPLATLAYLSRGRRRYGLRILRMLYLDAEVVRLGCDLIHFEFGAPAAQRMYLRDLLGCPVIVSFRGYDLNYVGLEEPDYYAEVWQKAAAVHLLGEDLWRRARHRGCPPEKPHALIPPAIDTRFFDPGEEKRGSVAGPPLRILSVGRLEWKKGYEDALVAVRKLLDRGIRCEYRILGAGAFLGALGFARYQLGLMDQVTFLGAGSRQDVKTEMSGADVFFHAAVSEGFCNAVLEAQAMRLPVVCTDADGLPENVEDGVTGLVVGRRNTAAMADALAKLAGDEELRRQMGRAGRDRVTARFQLQDQVSAFEELYRSVLSGPPEEVERFASLPRRFGRE
jgi:colanic acid/amylovoran biosynthesis glycosyltransferase